jgi:hypothetical protein
MMFYRKTGNNKVYDNMGGILVIKKYFAKTSSNCFRFLRIFRSILGSED